VNAPPASNVWLNASLHLKFPEDTRKHVKTRLRSLQKLNVKTCRVNFFADRTRGVDPYGTGGHVSPIFMKVMSPPIFWGLFYPLTATTVVCCILMQMLCVVSQKSFNFPRSPTGAPPLDPAGGIPSPRPPVFFYVPPIIMRSTPLHRTTFNTTLNCFRFAESSKSFYILLIPGTQVKVLHIIVILHGTN